MGKHVDPREAGRLAGLMATRALIESNVERLIRLLDLIDAETEDLESEDEDDPIDRGELDAADWEPWLGAPELHETESQGGWAKGNQRDLEIQCEDEGACVQSQPHDADPDEPPLGWTENVDQDRLGVQHGYGAGWSEDEPSLGSLERIDQRLWSKGANDDRELALGSLAGEDA